MAMYHAGHPNGNYEMANLVEVFDRPRAIAWKPGTTQATAPSVSVAGSGATTWHRLAHPKPKSGTLYDWSAVPEEVRRRQAKWPPFYPDHLDNSLARSPNLFA